MRQNSSRQQITEIPKPKRAVWGWIAAFCFMFSGLPAAITTVQTQSIAVPLGTLILWTIGEFCALIYIVPKRDYPLIVNYVFNLILLAIIWAYL